MRKAFLVLVLLLYASLCNAQSLDSLRRIKRERMILNNEPLIKDKRYFLPEGISTDTSKNKKVLSIQDENIKYFRRARTAKVFATIFGIAGSALVAYSLTYSIASGESANVPMFGIGVGLIAVAIPLSIISTHNLKKARKQGW